jgi:glycerol-3-phosphate dehydrogenase (NAD(P)+)
MVRMPEKITVIGDGAMGTVCAVILAKKGYNVNLWGYNDEQIRQIREHRENRRFLAGTRLPISIELTADDQTVFQDVAMIVSAVPCVFLRSIWERLNEYLPPHTPIVSVTKGIENKTLQRPSQIIGKIVSARSMAVFSGPNIATELVRSLPATSTAASLDPTLAQLVQKVFSTNWFRIYTNSDVVGVELAGATKNVIAIAAGIIDGLHAGDNAKAALLTRGLVEITRLGVALGAQAETFAGLSGMGDLITTCISPSGRNRTFGQMIAKGSSVEEALDLIPGQVEGVNTCRSLMELCRTHNVEMPITTAVYQIIFEGKSASQAITELMTRQLKAENNPLK